MKTYHKIDSVFLRDPQTKHKNFFEGEFTTEAFRYLAHNEWLWSEKIDGTNVRVFWDGTEVRFGGRSDNAQMPDFLMEKLQTVFTADAFAAAFPTLDTGSYVQLYGEGYGARIQKGGGNYKPDGVDFILFDAVVNDIYLQCHNVEDVAAKLAIDVVPIIGRGTLYEAVEFTRNGFASTIGTAHAEGLVMRPAVELVDRMGRRVITKVKTKDFV
jgi:hypothetical protein